MDGSNLQANPTFSNLEGGNYTVYIQDAAGCEIQVQSAINEPPLMTVDLGIDIVIELGDSVQLNAVISPTNAPVSYNWTPPDSLSCADCPSPILVPIDDATFQVVITDTLTNCMASDEIAIIVEKVRNVFIPNAFTPNGDNVNDVFMIFGNQSVSQINVLRIYDRWGELVFEKENFPTDCLLYTSPSPRDLSTSRMPSSA